MRRSSSELLGGACLVGLLMLGALLAAPVAHAQTDADRATAQAMLQAGVDAAQDGDWEAARVAFGRAYTLVASTRVLMNLAGAQRHCGHLLEARESYQRWLVDATERDASYRPTVEEALAEIATEIPQLVVEVRNLRAGDRVDLDGAPIEIGAAIEADPGSHVVTLSHGTTLLATETIDLVVGDHQTVGLAAPSIAAAPPPTTRTVAPLVTSHDDEGGGDVTSSPWFWAGIGGGAAVVLGVIIGVAVATSSSGGSSAPDMGTLGPFRL